MTPQSGASGTANQGFAGGGSSGTSNQYGAGGGGGAGAVGTAGSSTTPGNGGDGVSSNITDEPQLQSHVLDWWNICTHTVLQVHKDMKYFRWWYWWCL